MIGGSSAINGMIYMRGQAADYDHWRQLGNPGWSWDDVLPYFMRSEDRDGPADELHGQGGEWRVENRGWPGACSTRSARRPRDRHSAIADFNRGDNEGTLPISRSTRAAAAAGRRRRAFLKPVLKRTNLTAGTNAQALRLVARAGASRRRASP